MLLEGIILIAIDCLLGFEIVSFLIYKKVDLITRTAIGSSFGIILSSWIFLLSRQYIPLTELHGLLHIIIFSIASFIIHKIRPKSKTTTNYKMSTLIFAVVIPFIFLGWMFHFGMFYKHLYTKGSCYGDLPFHLNIISSFAHGCNSIPRKTVFDLLSPFYSNLKLAYPIIPDFYSAVLFKCFNVSYHDSIVFPSLIYAYSILVTLTKLVALFTHNPRCCLISSWLFLMSGGLGFTRYFNVKYRNEFNIDYVHNWGGSRYEAWFQTVIHVLMPQRSSLFSMPIVYSILCLLIIYGNSHQIDLKSFTLIGLLVSCLPQVQAHSIIALAQWGVIYVILTFPYRKIKTQFKTYVCNYGILSIVAIVFGVPQMIPLLERTSKTSGFMKIAPIWSDSPGKNYLTYWVNALGVFFIISMLGIFVLHNKQLKMYIAALGVFFAANFIWYQPWSLDNTKIFNAGWIPFAVALVSKVLVMIWDKKYIGKILALPLFVLCIASGALANVKAIGASYPLWAKNADVFGFAEFVKSTDPIAVWLTDSSHTNPVVTLGGRQTVLGYRGWIYSHGIDDSKRFYDIQRIMGDPDNVKLTDKYDVKYVAVDKQNNEFKFAPRSDSRNWKKIYESKIFVVYNRTK